jgi:hypothetical protein
MFSSGHSGSSVSLMRTLYRVMLLAAIVVVFAAVGYGAVHIARDGTTGRQQQQRPIPATLLPLYGLHPVMHGFPASGFTYPQPSQVRPGRNARMSQ